MKVGISRNTNGLGGAEELVRAAVEFRFMGIQFKTDQLRAWDFSPGALDRIGPLARPLARGGVVFHPGADFNLWPGITESVLKFTSAVAGEHVCYCFCPLEKNGVTWQGLADELTRTGRLFVERGIGFSFHNHTHSMMGTQEQIRRLCDLLDPTICGLTFDTAHAAACGGENVPTWTEAFRSHINNVHLKDLDDSGQFCPLGRGKLPLDDVIAALSGIGYTDWLIVDEESARVSSAEACRISMDFVQKRFK
jgi:sugar phosphate isomerase/epimerase